jgi:hypothetical protein
MCHKFLPSLPRILASRILHLNHHAIELALAPSPLSPRHRHGVLAR